MNSRERVLAAFEHVEPDRVPAWCGASVEFWERAKRALDLDDEGLCVRFGDDFRRVWARYVGPAFPLSPGAVSRSVFGVERWGIGYGQPMTHPLAGATLARVHEHPWPDPAWMDVSHVRADAERYGGQYAILGGDWSPFWHDAIDLLGMDGLYVKMYEEPALVDAVMQHLVDYYATVSERMFAAAADVIDIFFIGNHPAAPEAIDRPGSRIWPEGDAALLWWVCPVDSRDDRSRAGWSTCRAAVVLWHGPSKTEGGFRRQDPLQRRG
jgi:uroporphyrinogen decarboxylase